jgi:BirA family transcriptional regulator, biotin operon repressor / biotin---[acetyl-CoA-carboxylase] ligase
MIHSPREKWHLDTRRLGRRVLVFDQVDSTNTQAAALAEDQANDGIVLLADEQTAGRGQHGRTWTCPAGVGVLLSVLIFPSKRLRRPVILAAWAANSVCETIGQITGLQARIKWPNDVLVRGRKVCGILIEQARGTVVGVGLNVNQSAQSLEDAGLPHAGSLAFFSGGLLDRWQAARQLIVQLDEEYDRLCQGDLDTLEACWKRRTGLIGQHVIIECQDGSHRGRLLDISWSGLQLQFADGELTRLLPETIKHVTVLSAE